MTKIEWTDATWNPVIGCRHVSEGCRHCYAETMSKRLAAMGQEDYASILDANGRFSGKATTRPETLAEPLRWKKPRMVFVNSMSDLFHEDVPFEFVAAVFGVMAACPQHTFQVLTKRPERALKFFEWCEGRDSCNGPSDLCVQHAHETQSVIDAHKDWEHVCEGDPPDWPLKNVWLGVSVATQADADKNIPILLKCPAAVRFVSAEPLIEAVNLRELNAVATAVRDGKPLVVRDQVDALGGVGGGPLAMLLGYGEKRAALDWIIVGGESGPSARPCDIAWIRSIVEQCKAARVPCFVKQIGALPVIDKADIYEAANAGVRIPRGQKVAAFNLKDRKGGDPNEWPEDLRVREFPESEVAHA